MEIMAVAEFAEPSVVSAVPGRVRVHLDSWSGTSPSSIESRLRQIAGVVSARASSLTRNVLVRYDVRRVDLRHVLDAVKAIDPNAAEPAPRARRPRAVVHKGVETHRANVTVPGLHRDPAVGQAIAKRLRKRPGVISVSTSPLTGRIQIEFLHREIELDDVLEDVASVEIPGSAGEDLPDHPLDRGPLLQSSVRTVGAALGATLLGTRQLTGIDVPPGAQANALGFVTAVGIVQTFPRARDGIRRLLGRHVADLLVYGATIVGLTLAGSPFGLALAGAEAVRLLTEIVPRRRAWLAYERRLQDVSAAEPGAECRMESGERTPLAATVIEGTGTATGRNGLPIAVAPGGTVAAGSRLFGGPFVIQLQAGQAYEPQARPAPIASSLYSRYINALTWGSFAYAGVTALVTRSIGRSVVALLLVGPRAAVIGREAADTGASARVLRSGVTVVGTRPDRPIRRADTLLFDGARSVTDGFELSRIIPLDETLDRDAIAGLATSVAAAVGLPWGSAIAPTTGAHQGSDGSFDGATASASVAGTRYTFGPPSRTLASKHRRQFRGEHVVELRRDGEDTPLALIGLRSSIAPGVPDLVQTCKRYGIELAVAPLDSSAAEQELVRRAGIELLETDALEAVRARQEAGSIVIVVSDSAEAAPAFEAGDLAIGLTPGSHGHFPARADLLAADISSIEAVLEAGVRRDLAVRDAVVFSIASNIFGAVWGLRAGLGLERAARGVYISSLLALLTGWARLRGGSHAMPQGSAA